VRRLSVRLLVVYLLLLFLPIGSFLYLDTFETQLLEKLERAMVQEGRLMASALSGRDLEAEALRIMTNLAGRVESRIRVVDREGRLLADSAVDSPAAGNGSTGIGSRSATDPRSLLPADDAGSVRDELLYRVVVPPVRRVVDVLSPPIPPLPSAEFYGSAPVLSGPEIDAALAGRYGAATRVSTGGQRSVTLYSAIPVVAPDGGISGAVLVSRSTFRILGDLYRLRLDIIRIFLISVAAALILSGLLSLTITRPLRKLRDRAEFLLQPGSNLREAVRTGFPSLRRHDEIGDLSRSLQELWRRLEARIGLIDDFSADILHEVKNPLAAIRGSAEVVATELGNAGRGGADGEGAADESDGSNRADRTGGGDTACAGSELTPFVETILQETGRIDRLLGELREITRIDTHLEWEDVEAVAVASLVREVVALYGLRGSERGASGAGRAGGTGGTGGAAPVAVTVAIDPAAEDSSLRVNEDRLRQVLGNLLDNAVDFARTEVGVTLSAAVQPSWMITIAVEDDGPGIPPRDTEQIFRRFYSGRTERNGHDGLGLAVCRAIVEGYGGTITARNRPDGGAKFEIVFPRALGID
jgi:two-component system, OmpR family, sensor histidine kinase ChvG